MRGKRMGALLLIGNHFFLFDVPDFGDGIGLAVYPDHQPDFSPGPSSR
jgi:hypothetical protein